MLVYDTTDERWLVAAVEIVSPANKDRPANRRLFLAKCAALLARQVCVSIVDLVTTRQLAMANPAAPMSPFASERRLWKIFARGSTCSIENCAAGWC